MNNYIQFLGTSGGRFVMAKQLRSSAGTFIHLEGKNIILDPGPGTLVRCVNANPSIDLSKIDAIILSHNHIDHSSDLNVMIDVITRGGISKKKVLLFAPSECIDGENRVLLSYLKNFVKIITLKPCTDYAIGNLKFITSIEHKHKSTTYGIIFNLNSKKVSFLVDTQYFPELVKSYNDSEVLIMNVVMNKANGKVMHLCVDDARKILAEIKPGKAIITHFGITMLKADTKKVAKELEEETKTKIIAAEDRTVLNLDELNKLESDADKDANKDKGEKRQKQTQLVI